MKDIILDLPYDWKEPVPASTDIPVVADPMPEEEGREGTPILFLDLDGTVRLGKDELGKFVNGPEDVKLFDEVPELIWGYKELGWRVIGVSNQAGVGLGYMTMETCFQAMGETQRQSRVAFDKIVFCAHKPDAGCPCRKPNTAMIVEARNWLANHYHEAYPRELSLFVGDRPEDEQCALNAGIKFLDAETWRTGLHLETLRNSE